MRTMYQLGQLPEWMDMGDEEDFVTPSISLTEQLKKKMAKPKAGLGGLGGGIGGMVDFGDAAPAATGMAKGGPKSL